MGENTCKNIYEQGLTCRICNSYNSATTNKPRQPYEKWVKHLNRHFFKEDIKGPNKHMKKWSATSDQENYMVTMRYHFTPT